MKHIQHQRYRMGVISKSLAEYVMVKITRSCETDKLHFRLKKKGESSKEIEELESNILKRKAHLSEIEQTLPKPNGMYLKIILGNVNVSILNREQK